MTKKIILVDGTEFPVTGVLGAHVYYQNANRDSLTFMFDPAEVDLDTIVSKFFPQNLETITIIETDDHDVSQSFTHPDYTIVAEYGCAKTSVVTNGPSGIGDTPVVDPMVNFVICYQVTTTEKMLATQGAEIDDLIVAVLEG